MNIKEKKEKLVGISLNCLLLLFCVLILFFILILSYFIFHGWPKNPRKFLKICLFKVTLMQI